jgi:hypothetical protein
LKNVQENRKRNNKIQCEKYIKYSIFNIFGFLLILGFFIFYYQNKLFKNNSSITNDNIEIDSKSFPNSNVQTNLPKIKVPDYKIEFPKKDVPSIKYEDLNDQEDRLLKDSQTREILQKIRNSR